MGLPSPQQSPSASETAISSSRDWTESEGEDLDEVLGGSETAEEDLDGDGEDGGDLDAIVERAEAKEKQKAEEKLAKEGRLEAFKAREAGKRAKREERKGRAAAGKGFM